MPIPTPQDQQVINMLLAEGAQFMPVTAKKKPIVKFSETNPDGSWKRYDEMFISAYAGRALLSRNDYFLIDIDSPTHNDQHPVNGMDAFKQFLADNNINQELIARTLLAQTASGGTHIIFRKNPNYDKLNRQFLGWLPNNDIKANPNGYIVTAPTMTAKGEYHFITTNKPQVIPDQLCEAILGVVAVKSRHAKGGYVIKATPTLDDDLIDSNGVQWFNPKPGNKRMDAHYACVPDTNWILANGFGNPGGRNYTLFAWANKVLRNITSVDGAIEMALSANDQMDDPLDEEEVEKTVYSAFGE